jgi:hypothetical protein
MDNSARKNRQASESMVKKPPNNRRETTNNPNGSGWDDPVSDQSTRNATGN